VGSPKNIKDLPSTIFGGLHQMWLRGNFLDEARSKLETQFNKLASTQENFQSQIDSISEELAELQGVASQLDAWSMITIGCFVHDCQLIFGYVSETIRDYQTSFVTLLW
jgi:hypothetical protein